MSGHIATCSDKDPKYFMLFFYKMKCDSILARKEKGKYFINKFNQNSIRYKRHRVEIPNKNVLQPPVYTKLLKEIMLFKT